MHRVQTGRGGKVVVGFHGWSGYHRTFQPLLEKLPEATSFYSYDLPGCGQTPEPPLWEIREVARSLAMELVGLEKENLTLLGSCTGGIDGGICREGACGDGAGECGGTTCDD